MADTCIKQILDSVNTHLGFITLANGYHYDIQKIEHERIKPFNGFDIPAINYWELGFSIGDAGELAYGYDKRILPVYFEGYNAKWDDGKSNIEADQFAADILTCLYRTSAAPKVSDSISRNLGDLVAHTKINQVQYIVDASDKPYCGVLVVVEFHFFAKIGDLYNIDNI